LTEEQIAALGDNRAHPGLFDERQVLAIEWAAKVTLNTARGDDLLFERLQAQFSEQEIVELTMSTALWNLTNRLNESFRTPLETALSGTRPVTHLAHEALLEYVRRVTERPSF
jgi:alkylhydroperoxidase family enzyme